VRDPSQSARLHPRAARARRRSELSGPRRVPGADRRLSSARADKYEIIELLLASGADIQQRGINDWTPLHYAAANDDVEAMERLLAHGADPAARTTIDHCATPLEEAAHLGRTEALRALRKLAAR
jgi:ankyrin repeat protein